MIRPLALALLVAACPAPRAKPDAAVDSPPIDTPGVGFTLKNYTAWCQITINHGAATTAAIINENLGPGVVHLEASPVSASFALGANMWHHTDADTGAGEGGVVTGGISYSQVTIGTTAKCVWVCCPFANGSGCPTTDQCP